MDCEDTETKLTSLTITLPLPPRACHPNARPHWRAKAAAIKVARWEAGLAARVALGTVAPPRWTEATVQATFYVARRGDQDGRISSLKPYLDSLADAGVIANDVGLTHLPVVQVCDPKRSGERKVVLVITELSHAS